MVTVDFVDDFMLSYGFVLNEIVEILWYKGAAYEAFSSAMARFMHNLMATGTLSQSLQVCLFFFITLFFRFLLYRAKQLC